MLWLTLSRREEGQDLTEYTLLIALVVLIAIAAIGLLGLEISRVLSGIASTLESAMGMGGAALPMATPTIMPTPTHTTCCD